MLSYIFLLYWGWWAKSLDQTIIHCPLSVFVHSFVIFSMGSYHSMNRASHHVIFSMGSCHSMNHASYHVIFFLWVVVGVWTVHHNSHHVIFSMGSCRSMNCASHPTWWTPSPWRSAGTALVAWRMWSRTSRKLSFCLSNGPTSSSTPLFSSLQKVRKSPSCSLHCSHVCIFCYVWRLWIFSCSFVTVIALVSWGHRYADLLFF